MAYGLKAFRKAWLGKETTTAPGTEVACDIFWRGEAGWLQDDREMEVIDEDIGKLLPSGRVVQNRTGAIWEQPECPATFEQLPYILSASVEGTVTGVADTGGSGKIYQFDRPVNTAAGAVATYTIETGDNNRVDKTTYAIVTEWTLSGAAGEIVTMSSTWSGKATTDGDFTTTAPTLPTVSEIMFTKGKLFIDATTLGTTSKTGTWLGFSMTWSGGNLPLYTGDGTTDGSFSTVKSTPAEITGEFTFEHDATAEAEITAARNNTVRYIRMRFQGDALTTAGSSYTYKTLQIDLAIQYTEIPIVDSDDADDVVTIPWIATYNTSPQIIVVNEVAAL